MLWENCHGRTVLKLNVHEFCQALKIASDTNVEIDRRLGSVCGTISKVETFEVKVKTAYWSQRPKGRARSTSDRQYFLSECSACATRSLMAAKELLCGEATSSTEAWLA